MRRLGRTLIMAMVVLLALGTMPALAAPGGGKGKPPTVAEETAGNNLSVPTHFVGGTTGAPTLRTPCPTAAVAPTGSTVLYDGIAYYLQKTDAVWSATCDTPDAADVEAMWGANLTNGRPFKAGRPIRVEMALNDSDLGTGYLVENLTPDLPDRNSVYGTQGSASTMPFMAWTAGAQLKIEKLGDPVVVVHEDAMGAEINSTGKVVYGFNWGTSRVNSATEGTYTLTFSVPSDSGLTITGVDPGEAGVVTNPDASTVTVTVVVAGGGGGQGPRR